MKGWRRVLAYGAMVAAGGLFLAGAAQSLAARIDTTCTLAFDGGQVLADIPLAENSAQQTRGLSKRDDVGPGMLFAWPDEAPRVFWMKDTRVPLSIGFFRADGLLFRIIDMEPETTDYHYSALPAVAALELPRGGFRAHGLRLGSRLIERRCTPLP